MELSRITPLRRTWGDGRPVQSIEVFEALFDTGVAVYTNEAELMSYRRFQREVLRQLGALWSHDPAEMRGGRLAWQMLISQLLRQPETVPAWTADADGRNRHITSIPEYRRQQREDKQRGAA